MNDFLNQKKVLVFIILLFQATFFLGCETLHMGKGFVVHDDSEALRFAWFWFNQENYDQARKMADVALDINPSNVDANNILGLIELRQDSLERSIEYLEKANRATEGRDLAILHNLGFAYFKSREYSKSMEIFANSLEQRKTCLAELGLAMSLFKLGDKNSEEQIAGCRSEKDFVLDTKRVFDYFLINDEDLKAFVQG